MPTKFYRRRRVRITRRRDEDTGGVSLAWRRTWYDDTPQDPTDGNTPTTPPTPETGGDDGQDWGALPEWARKEYEGLKSRLSEVNNESAQRRHQLNAYEERLKALEADRQTRMTVEEKLKDAHAQMESLRQYEDRAKALEARISESNQQRLERIPEHMRSLVPDLSPDAVAAWLDKNEALLTKPVAPNLDGGAGGGGGGKTPPALTDRERKIARDNGMTDEEWAQYKERARRG